MVLIFGRLKPTFQCFKLVFIKMQKFCCTLGLLAFATFLFFTTASALANPLRKEINIVLNSNEKTPLYITNKNYLSTALDSVLVANGFPHFNMTDPRLVQLLKPLAPGYLRIGGNMADRLWFSPFDDYVFKTRYFTLSDGGDCSNEEVKCDQFERPNFTMSATEWTQLNQLAQKSGLTILFDLNCLIRFPNGSWNSKNAEELIEFSANHNFSIIWELGNEPNAFRHVFNYEVNATQLAKDFKKLRSILNRFPIYRLSKIVGPDTTRPILKHKQSMIYLYNFLSSGKDTIDAITWHQYYFNGRNASKKWFLDPDVFDMLEVQITYIKSIINKVGAETKPIWLGETSSAYGGGAPGLSNTYISTFIWLDKLGVAAQNGLEVVIRQTLFGGNYALLDENLKPLPDWWVSVIYKNLVGTHVIPCYIESSTAIRLYCHCANKEIYGSHAPYIIVYGINVSNLTGYVRMQDYFGDLWEFSLTASTSLLSKDIQLNGKTLSLLPNGNLPDIEPKLVHAIPYVKMPPYSSVFWVIPTPMPICV